MEIKKLTDLPIGELGEENYVVADVDGAVKRIPAEDISGGDMTKSVFDPDGSVEEAGGIPTYVTEISDNKADLVDGVVPASQLPSYVDDIVEGYYYESEFYEDSAHTRGITPERGKIYIDLATNASYRWSGSVYVQIPADKGAVFVTASYKPQGYYQSNYTPAQIMEFVHAGRPVYYAGVPGQYTECMPFSGAEYNAETGALSTIYFSLVDVQSNKRFKTITFDGEYGTTGGVTIISAYAGPTAKLDPSTATAADIVNYINNHIHKNWSNWTLQVG